jgi:hypothetical protein
MRSSGQPLDRRQFLAAAALTTGAVALPGGIGRQACGAMLVALPAAITQVPAVLVLAERPAWRLSAWLDRLLPDLDVEGTGLRKGVVGPTAPAPAAEITDGLALWCRLDAASGTVAADASGVLLGVEESRPCDGHPHVSRRARPRRRSILVFIPQLHRDPDWGENRWWPALVRVTGGLGRFRSSGPVPE